MITTAVRNPSAILRLDDRGAYRVGGSQVLLDTVWTAHEMGFSAAEIADDYPTITEEQAKQVIDWCIANPEPLREYLKQREAEARYWRQKWEQHAPMTDLRRRAAEYRRQRAEQQSSDVAAND
jgi:uncharacterized protein (DUF433 family)